MIEFARDLNKNLRIRIPSWCKSFRIIKGRKRCKYTMDKGYAVVKGGFEKGDRVVIVFKMPVEVVEPDPQVKENAGKHAVMQGPVVFCAEEVDNHDFDKVRITEHSRFSSSYQKFLLGGVNSIQVKNGGENFDMIPYFLWDNRMPGKMKVWL